MPALPPIMTTTRSSNNQAFPVSEEAILGRPQWKEQHKFHFFPAFMSGNSSTSTILPPHPSLPPPKCKVSLLLNRRASCLIVLCCQCLPNPSVVPATKTAQILFLSGLMSRNSFTSTVLSHLPPSSASLPKRRSAAATETEIHSFPSFQLG